MSKLFTIVKHYEKTLFILEGVYFKEDKGYDQVKRTKEGSFFFFAMIHKTTCDVDDIYIIFLYIIIYVYHIYTSYTP